MDTVTPLDVINLWFQCIPGAILRWSGLTCISSEPALPQTASSNYASLKLPTFPRITFDSLRRRGVTRLLGYSEPAEWFMNFGHRVRPIQALLWLRWTLSISCSSGCSARSPRLLYTLHTVCFVCVIVEKAHLRSFTLKDWQAKVAFTVNTFCLKTFCCQTLDKPVIYTVKKRDHTHEFTVYTPFLNTTCTLHDFITGWSHLEKS